MQSFLNKIAKSLVQKYKQELGEIAIVLPNRRANIFLRNELSQQISSTTWAPSIFSLEDFVEEQVNLTNIDQIDLLFELFEIHKKIEQENAEPFEDFMNWGSILLYDFNEIDRYLVDAKELYSFLSEARAIETWNPETGQLSEFQKKYLKFWDKLHIYYKEFRAALIEKGLSYQGLAFRQAAENIQQSETFKAYKKIYFAGFNALTNAEQKILDFFTENHNAELLFDADEYYLNDKFQEAGKFLRKHKAKYGALNWESNFFKEVNKEIDIYGISGDIGQAKLVGNLLAQNESKFSNEKTAVVLSDESLLLPILDSLPPGTTQVNVTMGYALSNTVFYHFFEKYLSLYAQYNKEETSDFNGFYFKDCLELLKHPVWKILQLGSITQNIIKRIEASRVFFVNPNYFTELNDNLKIQLFENPNKLKGSFISGLIQFCEAFKSKPESSLSDLNGEVLYSFYSCFNRINQVAEKNDSDLSFKSIYQLYTQVVSSESVSFIGEPLSGLQVMGVLETRTLDFEHVILTSVNEGVLPSGKTQSTFIPYDIKRKFELPSYKEKDAIFAYHFYRLIQRAKKVSIIYNTINTGLNGGEKSRFILQLQNEIEKYNPAINIKEHIISEKLPTSSLKPTIIRNENTILNQIKEILEDGLSASTINTFIRCPLDFYYKKILKLRPIENSSENLELNEFGSIVHLALERLYRNYLNKVFDKQIIKELNESYEDYTLEAFKEITKQSPETGDYKVAFEIAKIYVKKIIDFDAEDVKKGNELIIKSVELKFKERLELNLPIGSINLKGVIDRIDTLNKQTRIVDYKTGGVERKDLSLKKSKLDKILSDNNDKIIQMMVYWLASKKLDQNIKLGIISTKNNKTEFLPLIIEKGILNDKLSQEALFTTVIEELLENMMSGEFIFKHNKSSKYCDFC